MSFKDFKVDYSDEAIALMKDARNISLSDSQARYQEMAMVVFVRQGHMAILIDGREHIVRAHQMLLCRPGRILSQPQFSADFEGHAIFLTVRYSHSLLAVAGNIWDFVLSIDNVPVFNIPVSAREILQIYYKLLEAEVDHRNSMYYREVVSSLLRCMLCTLISDIRRINYIFRIDRNKKPVQPETQQAHALFTRFVDMLTKEQQIERKLTYYSDALCVTPKYLSRVCKRVSGRTAHQWICETIANNIYNYLRFSDKSIKEIAYLFGFTSLGFFSRFVKENLGKCPSDIRKE